MSNFGLVVKNSSNHIQIDSIHENYFLLKKQTYTSQLDNTVYQYSLKNDGGSTYIVNCTFNNAYLIDVEFGFTLTYPPLIGYRSSQTAGYLKKYKKDSSGNYTGCIIQVGQDSTPRQAEVFVYGRPEYLGTDTWGLVTKNASSEVTFDSRLKLLKVRGFKSIRFQNKSIYGTVLDGVDYLMDGNVYTVDGTYIDSQAWGFTFTHPYIENPIFILPLMGQFGHLKRIYTATGTYSFEYYMRGYAVRNMEPTTSFFTVGGGGHGYIYYGGKAIGEHNMAFNEYYALQYDEGKYYDHLIMLAEE